MSEHNFQSPPKWPLVLLGTIAAVVLPFTYLNKRSKQAENDALELAAKNSKVEKPAESKKPEEIQLNEITLTDKALLELRTQQILFFTRLEKQYENEYNRLSEPNVINENPLVSIESQREFALATWRYVGNAKLTSLASTNLQEGLNSMAKVEEDIAAATVKLNSRGPVYIPQLSKVEPFYGFAPTPFDHQFPPSNSLPGRSR